MDPYILSKIGDVTIQRVSSNTENTTDSHRKDSNIEIVQISGNSQLIQLPKLPSSTNISVKSNNFSSEQSEIKNDVNESDRQCEIENKYYYYDNTSSEPLERESNENKHDFENRTEICDNVIEYNENISNDKSDRDYQILSTVQNDEESEIDMDTENVMGKMDLENEDEDLKDIETSQMLDKEFEDNSELPNIEQEFTSLDGDEYREVEGEELPEIPVDEFIESELPEGVICKEEQLSEKEDEDGDISDDADDESNEERKDDTSDDINGVIKKKKKRKTKSEGDSDELSSEKKKQKTSSDEKNSDSDDKEKSASELKVGNLRRNIREVMDETKLDEATLAAQMQEKERLRRVQEQLRANRDIQRQMMQARVLSLIEKGGTSIIKKEEEELSAIEEEKPNTVVVKLSSSSGPPQIVNKKMLDMLKKQNSSSASDEEDMSIDKFANLSKNLNKPQMMTASVSIAPVKQEQKVIEDNLVQSDEETPKNKDIVMISSSSGEDDDCIVISEDDEESEPEEDTSNSGMHTNDLYNVPDDQGRVLINVGHPDNEKDVFLAPQIARIIKPHQIGGVRFLFDNIVESLNRYRTSEGFGCILAHSMGLGKTLQVISFCDAFLRYTDGKKILCIMPINTLQNWVAEFNMWLPVDPTTSPLKEQGEVLPRQFPLLVLNDNQKTLSARANVIQNWSKEGGVLLIGYELYRQLSLKKPPKSRTRSKRRMEMEEDYEDEKSKTLLEIIYSALVKPGPDLVICDEGHRIKNSHASISQALKQIRSKRRVVLTGYPLQNNLLEYWCMVDFVRPNYLGTKTEFSNMFERPIQNGQCIDSTPQDVKLMRYRAHVLHSLLEGFVQRRSHRVLEETLPSKYEFVLLLRLTPFQRNLYNTFMDEVVRTKAVPNPLKAFAVCCKIWNHPDILYNFLKKRAGEEDIDLDIEETVPNIVTPASGSSTPIVLSTSPHQSNKRSRNRSNKGSQNKDAKLFRKNIRASTPQPINKQSSIVAIAPNTTNNPKPLASEQAITNTNKQPIPPFNAYNNQFSNFGSQSNDNINYSSQTTTSSNSQNFENTQFGPQEYNVQPNSRDFANMNYQQQNYPADGNYYQSDYNQNNYWQGNNENTNFYTNNTPGTTVSASTDEYYQTSSSSSSTNSQQNNSQYNSNDYTGQNDSTQPSSYASQNYNFEVNQQQMTYSTEVEQQLQNFNVSNTSRGVISSSNTFSDVNTGDEMNYGIRSTPDFTKRVSNDANRSELMERDKLLMDSDGKTNVTQSFSSMDNRNTFQSRGNVDQSQNRSFDSFLSQQTGTKKRPGRPPLQQNRSTISCGTATDLNRQKQNPNFQNLSVTDSVTASLSEQTFKPGLLGGAPVLKPDGQNFQVAAVESQNAPPQHLLSGNSTTPYQPNQLNSSGLLENIQSDELWNPSGGNNSSCVNEQNTLFQDQNYTIYNELQTQNQSFIPNDGPSLLGGVRASRSLLNEIQNNEIFNPSQSGYPTTSNVGDHNLFNLDGFNYLNDLQIAGHTSFMGLLEGVDDTLEINQNDMNSTNAVTTIGIRPVSTSIENQSREADNYVEQNKLQSYQSPTAEMPHVNVTTYKKSNETKNSGSMLSSVPTEKNVNDNIMGLASKRHVTLKIPDKKNEETIPSASAPTIDETTNSAPLPLPANTEFIQQSRLPSINIFNTSQNFIRGTPIVQESGNNFSHVSQFAYEKPRTNSTSTAALATQTSWDTFSGRPSVSEYNSTLSSSQNVREKSLNFNFNSGGQVSVQQVQNTQTGKMKQSFDRNLGTKEMTGDEEHIRAVGHYSNKEENYATVSNDNVKNRFTISQNIDLVNSNEGKSVRSDDKTKRNFYQSSAKINSEQNVSNNQFGNNHAAPSNVDKIQVTRKSQLANNNATKTFVTKNESVSNQNDEGQSSMSNTNNVPLRGGGSTFSCATSQSMSGSAADDVFKSESVTKDVLKSEYTEDTEGKMLIPEIPIMKSGKEEPGIPYDWSNEFFKDYEPGKIEASAKTLVFFCMLEDIIRLGDRILLFSQSLFTLDLIEDFLHLYNIPDTDEKWARNKSYFRLDGSTTALEREKLINEFNQNPSVHLFLVSTRAGSLGINLVGANRVVVFDASWNPCHDTQAVCRVYRYGQKKSCYVYRFVTDNCLEKKIYDRQINKQGMSDRIVDECNPDAHLTIKDVSNLCWDTEDFSENKKDFSEFIDKFSDVVIQKVIKKCGSYLSKEPFQHESLLVDRKDKKLSQAEKRMAKRGYELEKQACLKPTYGFYNPYGVPNRLGKPVTNVRPMLADNKHTREPVRRWIPAEVWQKQGMSAQEMTLPLDVVIPTSTTDTRSSIVLKAGQKVMVLKSPKGIYMQLENGKIIAIKTALKPGGGVTGPVKPGAPRISSNTQGGPPKMIPKPNVDRTLAALSSRRGVTVSPIRNRFQMRPNTNAPVPNILRPNPQQRSNAVRPNQPIIRTFQLPRSQSRSILRPGPSLMTASPANKQIFGPNSAVTISVANKKKMESQIQQQTVPNAGPSRALRDDYNRGFEKESGTSHLTEVNYDNYSGVNRIRDHSIHRSVDDSRKMAIQFNEYSNTSSATSGNVMEPLNSRLSYNETVTQKQHRQIPQISSIQRKSSNLSNMIPESLKYKKDINLTPVGKALSSVVTKSDNGKLSASELPNRSKYVYQQHQYQLPQQGKPSPVSAQQIPINVKPKPTITSKNVITNTPDVQRAKREVQRIAKNIELPKSVSQHSISIFPVNKKSDEDSQSGDNNLTYEQQQGQSVYQQSSQQQPQSSKTSGYYSNYQGKQYSAGNYYTDKAVPPTQSSHTSQYSNPYDVYKQQNTYASNFASQQSDYSQQQQQQIQSQSYSGNAQYSSVPYSNDNFSSTSYSSNGGGANDTNGEQTQYSNQIFRNTSSTQPAGSSPYDQYRTFYNYPSQGLQKNENSQHTSTVSSLNQTPSAP